jgi:hypothetical protein
MAKLLFLPGAECMAQVIEQTGLGAVRKMAFFLEWGIEVNFWYI